MLFQSTININGVAITNMTNDSASRPALDAIAKGAIERGANAVSLTCTHSGDIEGENASQFDVWHFNDYLFGVDNDGITV